MPLSLFAFNTAAYHSSLVMVSAMHDDKSTKAPLFQDVCWADKGRHITSMGAFPSLCTPGWQGLTAQPQNTQPEPPPYEFQYLSACFPDLLYISSPKPRNMWQPLFPKPGFSQTSKQREYMDFFLGMLPVLNITKGRHSQTPVCKQPSCVCGMLNFAISDGCMVHGACWLHAGCMIHDGCMVHSSTSSSPHTKNVCLRHARALECKSRKSCKSPIECRSHKRESYNSYSSMQESQARVMQEPRNANVAIKSHARAPECKRCKQESCKSPGVQTSQARVIHESQQHAGGTARVIQKSQQHAGLTAGGTQEEQQARGIQESQQLQQKAT
eukprot:1149719-Pelagomonas_calceolata.AAC.3